MLVNRKIVSIVAVKPIIGSNPHKSVTILEKTMGGTLRKSVIDGKMIKLQRRLPKKWQGKEK